MKSTAAARWRLAGGCLLAAIGWQYVYSSYLVEAYFASSPPRWLRSVHLWMPDGLALRLLNAFGFRYDIAQHHSDNTGFVLAHMVIEALMWATLFFIIAAFVANRKRADRDVAAA